MKPIADPRVAAPEILPAIKRASETTGVDFGYLVDAAQRDPDSLVAGEQPLTLDEVQRMPDLMRAVKLGTVVAGDLSPPVAETARLPGTDTGSRSRCPMYDGGAVTSQPSHRLLGGDCERRHQKRSR